MEAKNAKLFWVSADGGELKEIKGISNFEFSIQQQEDVEEVPLVPPFEVTYNPTQSHTLTFDAKLEDWQIRKLFYTRIPRKKKKMAKKWLAGLRGKCIYDYIKHLRYDYMRMFYWIK